MNPTYMGLDYSTQQLKAVLINEDCSIIHEEFIDFDTDIKLYGTKFGIILDGVRARTPVNVWIEATDLLINRLIEKNVNFAHIKAISGCAQQHGSVYWKSDPNFMINIMNKNHSLIQILKNSFSIQLSPVWLDASASKSCAQIEAEFGGPLKFAQHIGTKLYTRFTGPQIHNLCKEDYVSYEKTKKITLVSNFAATLWLGKFAPMDYSDACGTGFFSLYMRKWDEKVCKMINPNLLDKLDTPVPSNQILGEISSYFVNLGNFSSKCKIVAFTGDNPSTVHGLLLQENEICISLGTSDTVISRLASLPEHNEQTLGAFFMCDPIESNGYISLFCSRNGAMIRNQFCQLFAHNNWDEFTKLLQSTQPGNDGNIGLFLDLPEIQPENLCGNFLWDKSDQTVGLQFGMRNTYFADSATNIRALIEGQLLRERIYTERLGMKIDNISSILVTGGASINKAIIEVIAGVFGASVYTVNSPNSAALGGALRAKHAIAVEEAYKNNLPFSFYFNLINPNEQRKLVANCPDIQTLQVYNKLCYRLEQLENKAIEQFQQQQQQQQLQ